MRAAHLGKVLTAEHKAKISSSGKGIKKSEETKARMRKPKAKSACPHCGLLCAPHMMARHIDARHKEASAK
jgi:thiamine biosynthesis protein ThiC